MQPDSPQQSGYDQLPHPAHQHQQPALPQPPPPPHHPPPPSSHPQPASYPGPPAAGPPSASTSPRTSIAGSTSAEAKQRAGSYVPTRVADPISTTLKRSAKACLYCRRSKTRCTGLESWPCRRCRCALALSAPLPLSCREASGQFGRRADPRRWLRAGRAGSSASSRASAPTTCARRWTTSRSSRVLRCPPPSQCASHPLALVSALCARAWPQNSILTILPTLRADPAAARCRPSRLASPASSRSSPSSGRPQARTRRASTASNAARATASGAKVRPLPASSCDCCAAPDGARPRSQSATRTASRRPTAARSGTSATAPSSRSLQARRSTCASTCARSSRATSAPD